MSIPMASMRNVDGFCVERERSRSQPGDGREYARTSTVDLQEKVLAFLCCHLDL